MWKEMSLPRELCPTQAGPLTPDTSLKAPLPSLPCNQGYEMTYLLTVSPQVDIGLGCLSCIASPAQGLVWPSPSTLTT